jgi:hypothetical protein
MINHMITHLTNRCTNIDYSDELILMKITLPFPPPRSIAVKFNLQSTCRCQSSSRLLPWFRGPTDEEPSCQALNEATKGNDADSIKRHRQRAPLSSLKEAANYLNSATRNLPGITNSLLTWPIQIWRVGFFLATLLKGLRF